MIKQKSLKKHPKCDNNCSISFENSEHGTFLSYKNNEEISECLFYHSTPLGFFKNEKLNGLKFVNIKSENSFYIDEIGTPYLGLIEKDSKYRFSLFILESFESPYEKYSLELSQMPDSYYVFRGNSGEGIIAIIIDTTLSLYSFINNVFINIVSYTLESNLLNTKIAHQEQYHAFFLEYAGGVLKYMIFDDSSGAIYDSGDIEMSIPLLISVSSYGDSHFNFICLNREGENDNLYILSYNINTKTFEVVFPSSLIAILNMDYCQTDDYLYHNYRGITTHIFEGLYHVVLYGLETLILIWDSEKWIGANLYFPSSTESVVVDNLRLYYNNGYYFILKDAVSNKMIKYFSKNLAPIQNETDIYIGTSKSQIYLSKIKGRLISDNIFIGTGFNLFNIYNNSCENWMVIK